MMGERSLRSVRLMANIADHQNHPARRRVKVQVVDDHIVAGFDESRWLADPAMSYTHPLATFDGFNRCSLFGGKDLVCAATRLRCLLAARVSVYW